MNRPGLIAWVGEKLRANWSPEQIAGRIRLEYPEDQSMRISTETIYRWVHAAAQFGDTSYRHLRRAHKGEGGKPGMARAGACFPGVLISATGRGLWNSEPALGTGKQTLSAPPKEKQPLLSCTERRSRFLLLARAQDKTAASFNAALIPCLRVVPPKLRQALTLDNGSEMAGFREPDPAGLRHG